MNKTQVFRQRWMDEAREIYREPQIKFMREEINYAIAIRSQRTKTEHN